MKTQPISAFNQLVRKEQTVMYEEMATCKCHSSRMGVTGAKTFTVAKIFTGVKNFRGARTFTWATAFTRAVLRYWTSGWVVRVNESMHVTIMHWLHYFRLTIDSKLRPVINHVLLFWVLSFLPSNSSSSLILTVVATPASIRNCLHQSPQCDMYVCNRAVRCWSVCRFFSAKIGWWKS